MKNIFKMAFEFNGEHPEDINYINKALASMRFSDLKVEKILAGCMYFYDEHDEQGIKEPERRPVIHKILFECTCDDSENMHCYQIGAAALKKGVGDVADKFHTLWSREHPSRVMRYMWDSGSDNTDVFVFLHHEKVVG